MGTWSEINDEIQRTKNAKGDPGFDLVRRKYLDKLHKLTGRNVILYASRWLQGTIPNTPPAHYQVHDSDLQGFMETVHGLKGGPLDLILHTPGGDPNAAEGIVRYLRSKFTDIRVIVPQLAMSAGTMIACAADRILMAKHSYLGPVDPQMVSGTDAFPAQAVLDQFEWAQRDCQDSKMMGAWIPILPKYGPSLLMQCKNAVDLSRNLVEEWLYQWMLRKDKNRDKKSKSIAKWLGTHGNFKTHGRHLDRVRLKLRGLNVEYLEQRDKLQDAVLSIYHATTIVFQAKMGLMKIIENHKARAFITSISIMPALIPRQPPLLPPGAAPPGAPTPPPTPTPTPPQPPTGS